jgi:L-malate glycosyltransferase
LVTRKIRILHIIKSLGRGGAETLLPETLQLHDQSQFEFHYIYFLPWKDQMVGSLKQNGGTVVCIPANSNIQLIMRMNHVVEYIRRHNIELIHAHLPWAGILARLVGRRTGLPVIYTEHNKQERYHFLTRQMNLLTMNWLDRIIPVSRDVEESILKFKPAVKSKIKTILNGVNIEKYIPSAVAKDLARKNLALPPDKFTLGTIAVFRFQKRLDLWLEIAKTLADNHPDIHFLIVGDGPLKDQLLQKTTDLNIQTRVTFAGLQTEVRPYLAAMDAYMMTSIFEGLPIAMLEAMSSGLPVITTSAGGIKEVIRHGQDGLLCDVDQASRLVDYALKLKDDPEFRSRVSHNARQRITEQFSLNKMVHDLEDLYKSMIRLNK